MHPPPRQGTQAALGPAVAPNRNATPGLDATAQWRSCRQPAVPEPGRDGNDTLERYTAACTLRPGCCCRPTAPARPQHLATYDPAYNRHALASVRGGHHRDRAVAWPRKPSDDAFVHRGRLGNERARTRPPTAAGHSRTTLSATRRVDALPPEPMNYAQFGTVVGLKIRHFHTGLRIIRV